MGGALGVPVTSATSLHGRLRPSRGPSGVLTAAAKATAPDLPVLAPAAVAVVPALVVVLVVAAAAVVTVVQQE